jgi:hypothetical protein
MATSDQIRQVIRKIESIVDALMQTRSMVKGSFSTVYRKCGKPTCWCADAAQGGHVSTRITWNESGISRTRTVNEADRKRLHDATESYRKYRQGRRELRIQVRRLEELLDKLEAQSLQDIRR